MCFGCKEFQNMYSIQKFVFINQSCDSTARCTISKQNNISFWFFIEGMRLCLIIYKVYKLFTFALKQNKTILETQGWMRG